MREDSSMDRATSRFLHHLSTQNDDWRQSAWGTMNIEVGGVRMRENPDTPFDDDRAREVAESWGFELVDRIKISGRPYWKVRRTDAPQVDIIGGPRREIVRASPRAREEARQVLQETGVDILDADECYRIEEEASKQQASAVKGGWETSCLGTMALVCGGFGAMFLSTLAVSIPLIVLAAVFLTWAVRRAVSGVRNKKSFDEGHLANAEMIRRVVRAAEEDWYAGWRPSGLPR